MFPLAFILASTSSKIAIGVFLKIAQLYREAAVTRTHQTNEKGQWMPCHADHKKQTKKSLFESTPGGGQSADWCRRWAANRGINLSLRRPIHGAAGIRGEWMTSSGVIVGANAPLHQPRAFLCKAASAGAVTCAAILQISELIRALIKLLCALAENNMA